MSEEEKKILADLVVFGRRIAIQQPASHAKTDQERDDWTKFYDALHRAETLVAQAPKEQYVFGDLNRDFSGDPPTGK